ncbi:MAG TPA: DUF2934 domain-containing protein [Candidatus Acidoferrum sp.]|jgi:hypothetical protein|nr:DUF2934 domain-containing protein [Candidatus Acidoferrum sp.]
MAKPTKSAADPNFTGRDQTAPDNSLDNDSFRRDDAVAKLAYQLWLDRGCPLGSPEEDWHRAEQFLDAGSDPEQPAMEAPRRARAMTLRANSSSN